MASKFCPKCGVENPSTVKFCKGCGVAFSFVASTDRATKPTATSGSAPVAAPILATAQASAPGAIVSPAARMARVAAPAAPKNSASASQIGAQTNSRKTATVIAGVVSVVLALGVGAGGYYWYTAEQQRKVAAIERVRQEVEAKRQAELQRLAELEAARKQAAEAEKAKLLAQLEAARWPLRKMPRGSRPSGRRPTPESPARRWPVNKPKMPPGARR